MEKDLSIPVPRVEADTVCLQAPGEVIPKHGLEVKKNGR